MEAVELAVEVGEDPGDEAEAEAEEDLVAVAPGARISRIFAQFETHFKQTFVS